MSTEFFFNDQNSVVAITNDIVEVSLIVTDDVIDKEGRSSVGRHTVTSIGSQDLRTHAMIEAMENTIFTELENH